MTGWRLGYILANPTLIQAMNKIHQYVIMSAPTAAQYGAIEGLRKGLPHVQEMVDSYRARRNFIVSGFNRIGLQCHLPHGAFYVSRTSGRDVYKRQKPTLVVLNLLGYFCSHLF